MFPSVASELHELRESNLSRLAPFRDMRWRTSSGHGDEIARQGKDQTLYRSSCIP